MKHITKDAEKNLVRLLQDISKESLIETYEKKSIFKYRRLVKYFRRG